LGYLTARSIELQKKLAEKVIDTEPLDLNMIRLVAGVDVSVKNNISNAAVVVLSYPELEPIETVTAQILTPFPYIPGLLSFREGEVLVQAFEKLQNVPDVFLFDGMGKIHPRRIGIASHLGLWLNKPTIGCGKSYFLGTFEAVESERGSMSALMHKGEQLGVVLRTRSNVKPIYISVGHLADLETAITLTINCTPKYRLPRPIRFAHNTAGEI
jgi:deoxyribonuclease V